jgi:hypothetical protein
MERNNCEINEFQHFPGGAEENHRNHSEKRSQSETPRTRNKTPGRSNVTCRGMVLERLRPTGALTATLLKFLDHTQLDTNPVEMLRTSYQFVAEAANYTAHNKHKRRTYMLTRGLKTRDTSKREEADIVLWPQGHRVRPQHILAFPI